MPAPETLRAVLFDLDGTLLDTAPDLAYALNRVLAEEGRDTLPLETIRPHVSRGGRAMVKLGFGIGPEDQHFDDLRQRFLDIYRDNLALHTRLFPGMDRVLERIESRGLSWGIVTNKPDWLTDPLLESLDLARRATTVVSGNTTAHAKPHPEPILHACRQSRCTPEQCLYVGDDPRDIEAGRAAGTATLVALFGYIHADQEPLSWGADGSLSEPMDLLDWLPD